MRKKCPNQRRRRCRRRYDAVNCCLMSSRMLRLLMCCCQNTRRRHLWQRILNTSKRRRSARVVYHASEPSSKTETTRARYTLILVLILMRCVRNSGFDNPYMAKSFVIRDPRYANGSTLYFHVAYLQWQMVGGVGLGVKAIRLVFGQLIWN